MTRNLRIQLANQAEHALRAWFGDDLCREDAGRYLPKWRFAVGLDDDLRAEVLSRFPCAEPPSVPGRDWLPAVEADADAVVKRVVAIYRCTCGHLDTDHFGAERVCGAAMGEDDFCKCAGYVAPAVEADAKQIVAEVVAVLACPDCQHSARNHTVSYGCVVDTCSCLADPPPVEVQPDAEAVS